MKHYLWHENKVNENKVLSYYKAQRCETIDLIHGDIQARSFKTRRYFTGNTTNNYPWYEFDLFIRE